MKKTRRITRKLEDFLRKQELNRSEYDFLVGCFDFQQRIPQLTSRQWDVIMKMKKNKRSLVKQYGKDAEKVMYGRATNMAKKSVKEIFV